MLPPIRTGPFDCGAGGGSGGGGGGANGAATRPPTIPPNAALVFDIELVEIVGG